MLVDQIRSEMAVAAKEKDMKQVQALRLLLSALEYKRMQSPNAASGGGITPEEEIGVVKSEVKKRQEAIEIYEKAGETARATQEKEELEVLTRFMPVQMGEEEVRGVVSEVVAVLGRDANKGQVIGMVMGKIGKERVDGAIVARVVNEILS